MGLSRHVYGSSQHASLRLQSIDHGFPLLVFLDDAVVDFFLDSMPSNRHFDCLSNSGCSAEHSTRCRCLDFNKL
jgi:hypothetical protein